MFKKTKGKVLFSAVTIAKSAKFDPVISMIVVFLFYMLVWIAESTIEQVIWGERFPHFLDLFIVGFLIYYSGLVVYACSILNKTGQEQIKKEANND